MSEAQQAPSASTSELADTLPSGPRHVLVDPRGQRFAAVITVGVLIAVLLTIPGDVAAVLLAIQGVAFGLGAFFGLKFSPYGWIYRAVVRPRLGPPSELEAEQPPRFAQLVGFIFVLFAVLGLAMTWNWLAYVAAGMALGAAFLNAAFGFCLGCQVYLAFKRVTTLPQRP